MITDQTNKKAALSFIDAWNSGDLSKTSAYEDEGFMSEAPGLPAPMNAEQNRAYTQNFLTAFPDSKFEALLTIEQGDYVVVNWRVSGTNTGPLRAPSGSTIPPTGKPATVFGSTTYKIRNGKITHSWTFWDMSVLLTQLGLLPAM